MSSGDFYRHSTSYYALVDYPSQLTLIFMILHLYLSVFHDKYNINIIRYKYENNTAGKSVNYTPHQLICHFSDHADTTVCSTLKFHFLVICVLALFNFLPIFVPHSDSLQNPIWSSLAKSPFFVETG